jgi:endonuclease/exonuclease/phosphatase family metal-dependent hydrolase
VNLRKSLTRCSSYVGMALAVASGCDPFRAEFADVEPAELYATTRIQSAGRHRGPLKVMNYNVKFGGARIDFFFDCHGKRVHMTRGEVLENLERLASIINEVNPDILFVQEVDVDSKRSAYVDQVQYLLDRTQLNYAAYASQWRADFVPSDGVGPVDSGNAILSRWPLTDATRYALDLRQDQSALVRYFYLRRNILEATVAPGSEPIRLIAVHAEAYAQDGTKQKHIAAFEAHVDAAARRGPVIAAGDLNTLPPGTKKRHDFPDSACTEEYLADDFRDETTLLDPLYDKYESAIPLGNYRDDNAPYFTHSTSKEHRWNRTLDYVFSNRSLQGGAVLQGNVGKIDTMDASDHAPVVVRVEGLR